MTAVNASRYRHSSALLCSASALSLLMVCQITVIHAAPRGPKPDANASSEAFLQVYKVFTSPRCQNCHPPGDSPLQGDDSHVHLQNVRRDKDGHGVYSMRCNTCLQTTNLPGDSMPPGNPKWLLPTPEHKMVFVGRSPAELCRQRTTRKQPGDRSLRNLLEHVWLVDMVTWTWNPAQRRPR